MAKQYAAPLGLAAEAELAGLLHDLGKYAVRFQSRLRNPAIHGINHWAAGTAHAASLKVWAVAFAADGHHTGMPALNEPEAGTPLRQTVSGFADANRRLHLTGQCSEDAATLLARLNQDGLNLPPCSPQAVQKVQRFEEAMRTRMLFSCLVDADFLDTEQHFDASQTAKRVVTDLQPERALQILRRDLDSKPAAGPVNALRKQLLNDCLSAAVKSPGLFTLTAPTGSGKTLSSLAFALQHIIHHNAALAENDPRRFRRVIVVIPFTSICASKRPRRRRHRDLDNARNWSRATCPDSPANSPATRNGALNPPLVNGATMTVSSRAFISSGETMTTGRVLRISEPSAGSSRASQTSNLFIGGGVRPLPLGFVPFVRGFPERTQLLEITVQLRLWNSRQSFRPTLARPARLRTHDQRLVLNRHRRLATETAGVQQLFRQDQTESVADLFNLCLHGHNLPVPRFSNNRDS